MLSNPDKEKRKYLRHAVSIPIDVSLDEAAPFTQEHLKDVSLGGLCFKSKNFLDTGRLINIRINITKPVFEARGKVVWCSRGDDLFEIGVEFVKSQDAFRARMIEQIFYIMEYKKKVFEEEGRQLSNSEAALEWIKRFADDIEV
jgi:hypothetical protein